MGNRVFRDMEALRNRVRLLFTEGRVSLSKHAALAHTDLRPRDKFYIVRHGRRDQPAADRPPDSGVYVCWSFHPRHGLCRGVYAISGEGREEEILVITAFRE